MYPEDKDEVVQLYLDDIIPNRFQPREVFDEKALKELAVSIREHGVIKPIRVGSVNGKYEIIAGDRRYKASALAGLTKIPAIIRDLDDKESSKVALLENLQRKNLNPIEEARTYQKILELDQMTQEELAKTMGKSQSAVANKIRLLSLPDNIQEALLKEQISERHARALLNIPDAKKQKEIIKKIIETKMSVRLLEDEIKKMYPKEDEEEQEEKEESKSNEEIIASANSFVNSEPLIPTAELPADTSNYGKVTIAPPEGEEEPIENKFINYADVNKDEEDDDEENGGFNMPPAVTTIDIDKVKENVQDINSSNNNDGSALDNMLNFGNPTSNVENKEFITPAEKIVKTESTEETEPPSNDYFQIPELENLNVMNNEIINPVNNNIFISTDEEPQEEVIKQEEPEQEEQISNYTVEEATNKIKDLVTDLKNHGINLKTDEMNFEKSYQIIIKIDKTTNEE